MRDDQLGEVTVSELDEGRLVTRRFPTYTCGHCSTVVGMRADRVRERSRCARCGKLLCEQNELCRLDCTPLHALAYDHAFDADTPYARLAPAILAGCTTEEEARRRGFKI